MEHFRASLSPTVPGQHWSYVLASCESTTGVDLRAAFTPMDFRGFFPPVDFRAVDCLVRTIEQSEVILVPLHFPWALPGESPEGVTE
jgi:hypothetical protein